MFGIRYPVMSAPMGMHSGGRLAAAVSDAGGLGAFGGINPGGPDWVREQIRHVRSHTGRPFGVGYINNFIPMLPGNFDAALEEKAPVHIFSFGNPEAWVKKAKETGAKVICQAQTMEHARQAVAAGADVLIAQGNEAGGHVGTMTLLPLLIQVIDAFPDTPVLAAGGIASGRALAAVLAAGADGASLGTAFLATPEAVEVADAHKKRIVASDGEDTVFTEVVDIVEHQALSMPPDVHWPDGIGARVYNNRFAKEWHGREEELRSRLDEVAPAYLDAVQRRDTDIVAVYYGQSAASVKAIRPAVDILRDICGEAETILRERPGQLLT